MDFGGVIFANGRFLVEDLTSGDGAGKGMGLMV